MTLAATAGDPGAPSPNPTSFTQVANLLYLDERQTGFSYGLAANGTPSVTQCVFSAVDDAADFTHAVVAFLESHPALRAKPVVLVVESYGGLRAMGVLELLLRYRTAAPQWLATEIQAHLDAVLPDHKGTAMGPELVALQFGRAALIEPAVLGLRQLQITMEMVTKDPAAAIPPGKDAYDIRQLDGWDEALMSHAEAALAANGRAFLGVDWTSVAGLSPQDRGAAFRSVPAIAGDPLQQALTSTLGLLASGDAYFAPGPACGGGLQDSSLDNTFLDVVRFVRVLITNAKYDRAIYGPALVSSIETADGVTNVVVDTAPRAAEARPGWLRFRVPAKFGSPAADVEIRYPPYDSSGHMVTATQAADFAADLTDWLAR
jgi:hypothetical protein